MHEVPKYRALVVDDIPLVRKLTIRALSEQHFDCQGASDGMEATRLLENASFDVVVTDLKMPRRHGHALAVELLNRNPRPAVVVLTAVMEPRLTDDLLSRGVEHVEHKPVDYNLFAAKVRSIVNHKKAHGNGQGQADGRNTSESAASAETSAPPLPAQIGMADLLSHLEIMSRLLPVSDAAVDVYQMTRGIEYDIEQLAAAIQRDPSLTTEVFRLANSPYYNVSGVRVDRLEQAIGRIGQRRLGELSLAMQSLGALKRQMLPWMNNEVVWRTSIATGVAVELLSDTADCGDDHEGLLLAGIMYPLGRLVLATAYPDQYKRIVSNCLRHSEPMQKLEAQVFPEDHAKVLVRLLDRWNLSPAIYEPIQYLLEPYEAIQLLHQPTRDKVLLLKVAHLIGQIAVRSWEPWDVVEIPQSKVFEKFRVANLAALIRTVRHDTEAICAFRIDSEAADQAIAGDGGQSLTPAEVDYLRVGSGPHELFEHILQSMRFEPIAHARLANCSNSVVVQAIEARDIDLMDLSLETFGGEIVLISDSTLRAPESIRQVVTVPCSFKKLHDTIARHAARHAECV